MRIYKKNEEKDHLTKNKIIYYEAQSNDCNGCILSSINENEYELVLGKNIQDNEDNRQQIKIINKETQKTVFEDFMDLQPSTYHFQVLKPNCSWNKSGRFCFFSSLDKIKEISQKEALLKIL